MMIKPGRISTYMKPHTNGGQTLMERKKVKSFSHV